MTKRSDESGVRERVRAALRAFIADPRVPRSAKAQMNAEVDKIADAAAAGRSYSVQLRGVPTADGGEVIVRNQPPGPDTSRN